MQLELQMFAAYHTQSTIFQLLKYDRNKKKQTTKQFNMYMYQVWSQVHDFFYSSKK
jgi:hypothetical protein